MSQTTIIIGVALNGSIQTSSRSGFRIMSDSLIVFQPAIEEPSNISPSSSVSSSRCEATIVRCCHLPLGSATRWSTHSIYSSLTRFPLSYALAMPSSLFVPRVRGGISFDSSPPACGRVSLLPSRLREGPGVGKRESLDRVLVLFAGANAERGIDRRDEDLAVADAPGLRR